MLKGGKPGSLTHLQLEKAPNSKWVGNLAGEGALALPAYVRQIEDVWRQAWGMQGRQTLFKPFPLAQILEAITLTRPKQDAKDKGLNGRWCVVTLQKRSSVNLRRAKWCPSDRQCSLETLWVVINNRLHVATLVTIHYHCQPSRSSIHHQPSPLLLVSCEVSKKCVVWWRHAMATNAALIWAI